MTEREAAAHVGEALRRRGAEAFFHTPFAWFGDRAGLADFDRPSWRRPQLNLVFAKQFFPTERRLEPGMTGILDVAPIRGGLCADIGYAFSLGPNLALDRAMDVLRDLRGLILEMVRAGSTMRAVYRQVDEVIRQSGYENAHRTYPAQVIGHKVGRIPFARLPSFQVAGFDARTYLYFAGRGLASLPGLDKLPLFNDWATADAPPEPGLWAIEPHLRKGSLGAKWEELLVVTESDAYWLDDDLPHTRIARTAASA